MVLEVLAQVYLLSDLIMRSVSIEWSHEMTVGGSAECCVTRVNNTPHQDTSHHHNITTAQQQWLPIK